MKIYELKLENNQSRIEVMEHRATIKTFTLMYSSESDKYNQICKFIEELNENRNGHFYGKQKELIKAFGEIDDRFKELYKELYPHGGWRKGGRPKGSRTERTERLNLAVTPEEKEFLLKTLEDYRAGKKESEPVPAKKVKTVSDEYINAVQEIQKEQEQNRPKLRTLDEAFKEYQERHKGGKSGK